MAALTLIQIPSGGADLLSQLATAASGGDTYSNPTGREVLAIHNLDGTSTNVTIAVFDTVAGLARPARVIAVPAAQLWLVPLLAIYYDPANANRISLTYSKVTGPLKVGFVQ